MPEKWTGREKSMMQKKRVFKRFLAGMVTGAMLAGAVGAQVPAMSVEAAAQGAVGEVAVNPQIHYQTLKGWGTSMCWWGNAIGSWGDKDFNGNGRPDREEIAELAFSPEYLNLNIVRYNVGGGDKKDTSIKRVEGLVPGWTKDMTGTEDGTGTFNAEAFYAKKTEEMSDAGQLWMLEQANKWRKDTAEKNHARNDIINEVFSNSPPYYMTKSGSSTGGVNAASNLKEDKYDDFALYMARAAKWVENDLSTKFGAHVNYIEPMNEPDTNYWKYGSDKQEGCTFDPGAEQSNMMLAMKDALHAEEFDGALDDIILTGTDETALSNAINSFQKLTADAKNSMPTIGAHTYSGSDSERHTLRKLAKSYDKELWMSEITRGNYDTHSHDSMADTNTKDQSEGIMADLKYMQPSAWVAWLVADSEYECLHRNESWGLIHCVFEPDGPVPDYHTSLVNSDGSPKDGVPEEGYWVVSKQLYTMMQYSKYLKAGYTMIDVSDENMCAAVSPDGKELVIVAQCFSGNRNTTVDLSAFQNRKAAKVYRTSDEENCELVETQDVTDGVLKVSLPENSVATYVIPVETDMNNYRQIVESDIKTPTESGVTVSDMDKFTYTGTWEGQGTTDKDAKATFTFQGKRAALYAAKGPKGAVASISIDGGEPIRADLHAGNEVPSAMICDTGALAEGKHTIEVTMDASSAEGSSLALSRAEIIHGEVSMKNNPNIRKIVAYDSALRINFDEVIGSDSYTVRYGTAEGSLDTAKNVTVNMAVINGLTNGTPYYIQVEDSLGGISNLVTATPQPPEGNLCYFVDVGASNVTSLASGEQFGSYNSVLDQEYGEDPISGRSWGYAGSDSSAYYTTSDRWTSVRECASGVEYRFELPAGSYNVIVGMKDPWDNGSRYTDILVNGEVKDEGLVPSTGIFKNYKAAMASEGTLSVKAVKGSGNSSQSPMISFIYIAEYNENDKTPAEIMEQPLACTVSGVIPQLPKMAKAATLGGGVMDVPMASWNNVTARQFEGSEYTMVTVKGKAEARGASYNVAQKVQIVPEDVQYFIDCNQEESAQYASLNAVAGLKNEVADQVYVANSWGYLSSANGYDGNDSYSSGWYDPADDKIQYKLPMDAGAYTVAFGLNDWWYDKNKKERPIILKAYLDDSETAAEDWGTYVVKSSRQVAVKDLALSAGADVTLSLERGEADAPLLSFISIQKKTGIDRSALKAQMNLAGVLKQSEYTPQTFAVLENAVSTGMAQLLRTDATQQSVNLAAESIKAAIAGLKKPGETTPPNEEGSGGKDPIEEDKAPKKGETLISGKNTFRVTKEKSELAFVKTTNAAKTFQVPKTVTIGTITYKVTSVAANAFKNNKKLQKVTVSGDVASIGNNAFRGCKSLGKVTIGDKVATIGNNAFMDCKKLSSVTIGKNVKKIGKEAFRNCVKLKDIKVKSTKLTSIGKKAFQKINAKAKIKVPAKKLKIYKKRFKGKGLGKKVKIY